MTITNVYNINETILWVEDTGEKHLPVIFCLHSLFLDGTMFEALADQAQGSYRVICPDFRGQGSSAPVAARSVTMDTCADDMLALIEAMGLADIHLVGASMGGDVAARMAARRPDLFRSLVFMGSSVREEPEEQKAQFRAWLDSAAEIGFVGDNLALLIAVMFGETSRGKADADARLGPWIKKLETLRRSLWPAMFGVLERGSAVPLLRNIKAPTLVYSGKDDFARPPEWGQELAEGIAGARLVPLDGVGHSPVIEVPEIVIPQTLAFIAQAHASAA
ncbi:alpha/beta hydrolase [Labrenzia sp. ac12]